MYINNFPTSCNTKQSIYYSTNSLYVFRVLNTPIIRSTQNCNYSLRYCAAISLHRGQASLATKHVEWTCRVINRLLCVASHWTNIDIKGMKFKEKRSIGNGKKKDTEMKKEVKVFHKSLLWQTDLLRWITSVKRQTQDDVMGYHSNMDNAALFVSDAGFCIYSNCPVGFNRLRCRIFQNCLTLIVLMWRIGWAHNNARK